MSQTPRAARPAAGTPRQGGPGRGPSSSRQGARRPAATNSRIFTDKEVEDAKNDITKAFSLAGLGSDSGRPVCPNPMCQTSDKGKVKLFSRDGGWKCFKCGEHGNAYNLVAETFGWDPKEDFLQIIAELLDRTLPEKVTARKSKPKRVTPKPVLVKAEPEFVAKPDPDVFKFVLTFDRATNVAAAQQYYGQFHIGAEQVRQSCASYITDVPKLHKALVAEFGMDRLVACGLVSEFEKDGKTVRRFLLNEDYPIVEPHISPKGEVTYVQFRCSPAKYLEYKAHVEWKAYQKWAAYEAFLNWRAAGNIGPSPVPEVAPRRRVREARYVAKFYSIKGAPTEAQIGMGLHRLWQIYKAELAANLPKQKRSTVVIVEGFKDLLAAMTMGQNPIPGKPRFETYAIAGIGAMPNEKVCELLSWFNVLIALDGDEAGEKGRAMLAAHLAERNCPAQLMNVVAGLDVTDQLVARHAFGTPACACETCRAHRISHPAAA